MSFDKFIAQSNGILPINNKNCDLDEALILNENSHNSNANNNNNQAVNNVIGGSDSTTSNNRFRLKNTKNKAKLNSISTPIMTVLDTTTTSSKTTPRQQETIRMTNILNDKIGGFSGSGSGSDDTKKERIKTKILIFIPSTIKNVARRKFVTQQFKREKWSLITLQFFYVIGIKKGKQLELNLNYSSILNEKEHDFLLTPCRDFGDEFNNANGTSGM